MVIEFTTKWGKCQVSKTSVEKPLSKQKFGFEYIFLHILRCHTIYEHGHTLIKMKCKRVSVAKYISKDTRIS